MANNYGYGTEDQRYVKNASSTLKSLNPRSNSEHFKNEERWISSNVDKIKDSRVKRELEDQLREVERKHLIEEKAREERYAGYQKNQQRKQRELILEYSRIWKNKNFLWKLFHQKYNPKNKNLHSYNMNQLEKAVNNISKGR